MTRLVGCVGALALWILTAAAAVAQPSAEDYGRLPAFHSIELSPDGLRIAVLLNTANSGRGLLIRDLESGEERLVNVTDLKVRSVSWAGDDYVILTATQTARRGGVRGYEFETAGAFAIDAETLESVQLMTGSSELGISLNTAHVVGVDPDGQHVFMPAYRAGRASTGTHMGDEGGYTLFRVDLRTGNARSVFELGYVAASFHIDANGQLLATSEYDQDSREHSVHRVERRSQRLIYRLHSDLPVMSVVGLSQDGANLVASMMPPGEDFTKLYEISLSDGSISSSIGEGEGADVGAAIIDPYTKSFVGYVVGGANHTVHYVDDELRNLRASLGEAFGGQRIGLLSWSRDRQKFIVFAEGSGNPGSYFLFDRQRGSAEQLADRYPNIPSASVSTPEIVTYVARDGLQIPAILTLPPGVSGPVENLPLVVLPHGGPESHDTIRFDWLAQFIASRGYVVLQPNFRGSTGYGEAFREAGHGKWGREMQWDISDGVLALIDEGVVDPERVCIVGFSYGGYAALAGATFTPELYRCVVAGAPISDIPRMMAWDELRQRRSSWSLRYWDDLIGDENRLLREISPARHVENVRAPVLLFHGTDDTVVPFEQSEIMQRALSRAGKDVELVRLQGDDHWLSTGPTRIQMLTELERFLAEHLAE